MEKAGNANNNTNIGYWEQVLKAPTPAYQELFDAEREFITSHIPSNAKVLDIGCGEGRNMKSITLVTRNVTGLDNDAKAVEDAKNNFSQIPTAAVVQGSADALPFQDGSFDVVTALIILPNLGTSKTTTLRECARVLKEEGKILLSTFSETAFDERMKVYKMIKAPIKKIEGTTVVFDESIGANISEQFSQEQLRQLADSSGLFISEIKKVGDIAYLCEIRKNK
jgi:ubiquinone/menaquinone biosynthesis C-methylase UbiE